MDITGAYEHMMLTYMLNENTLMVNLMIEQKKYPYI